MPIFFFFKEEISKSRLKEMALEFLGILYRGSNRDGFLINCQGYFSQKRMSDMWVLGANCANTDAGGSFRVSNRHHKPHTSATIKAEKRQGGSVHSKLQEPGAHALRALRVREPRESSPLGMPCDPQVTAAHGRQRQTAASQRGAATAGVDLNLS